MDLATVLEELASRRPLFHSERDFQHALAWSIQQHYADAEIRLEPRPRRGIHLDLLVRRGQRRIAIEVKYLVAAFSGTVDGERYELPNQGAQDIARYDVIKDIVRLESLVADEYADEGLGITLSSDSSFWRPSKRPTTIDAAFRIHESRTLTGVLAWSSSAGAGTMRDREQSLCLTGSYPCAWQHYSTVTTDGGKPVELRYLALPVQRVVAGPIGRFPTTPPQPDAAGLPRHLPSAALTARAEILVVVADITRRSGREEFELDDVVAEMRRRGMRYSDSTIRTYVTSRMCADAPDHHATTFDDFERLDRGLYRLRRSTAEGTH